MSERLREIALGFLKLGATAYGGPAIMGVMQAEFQDRRQWVSRSRFVEGLSLVNMLPGAAATQLGIFLGYHMFHSRGWGAVALVGLGVAVGLVHLVTQLHWLTPQEFLDGLALGHLTPGPVLIVAAYVGYKVLGVTGAVTAAAAIFLPSFVMMLAVLPAFERVRTSVSVRAARQGIGPAVIGVLAVSLARLLPHAAPDRLTAVVLVLTVTALAVWRLAPLKVMLAGAVVGAVRSRVAAIPALRALLGSAT